MFGLELPTVGGGQVEELSTGLRGCCPAGNHRWSAGYIARLHVGVDVLQRHSLSLSQCAAAVGRGAGQGFRVAVVNDPNAGSAARRPASEGRGLLEGGLCRPSHEERD